jgi:hypothetical protein
MSLISPTKIYGTFVFEIHGSSAGRDFVAGAAGVGISVPAAFGAIRMVKQATTRYNRAAVREVQDMIGHIVALRLGHHSNLGAPFFSQETGIQVGCLVRVFPWPICSCLSFQIPGVSPGTLRPEFHLCSSVFICA